MTTLNFPPNLPISQILFKQCKLWVWDFDDTLIDTTTYYSSNMSPDAILERKDSQLDVEVPQWRYFRRLVEFLVGNGRYVGIASFGTYEIIQAYMKRIMGFNQQFFTRKNIIAPEHKQRDVFRFNQPPNKNEYIYQLMRIYRVQDFKRVVLFDDNATNIADAIGIGIVAVQVPSKNGGDKPTNEQMMFGPWLMSKFDANLERTCGQEIYQNRTYTGLVSKENYTGLAYDGKDIDFGTGVRARDGYLMEPYDLGVNDSSVYKGFLPAFGSHKEASSKQEEAMHFPAFGSHKEASSKQEEAMHFPAFGTGIGDRKINARPQFAWNAYRMPRSITPKWWNGNYMNVPGEVKSTGYWDADTLGGSTPSYWDKYQSVLKQEQENEKKEKRQIIYPSGGTGLNVGGNNVQNIVEGFDPLEQSDKSEKGCGCGVPPTWMMILLFIVVVLIVIVMLKL
jgi:hypothetical protein